MDDSSVAHIQELLTKYPQSTRIGKYLELNLSAIWQQVKQQQQQQQKQPSVQSSPIKSSVDNNNHLDLCAQFERAEPELRVRLVLTEMRMIAIAIRKKNKYNKQQRNNNQHVQHQQQPSVANSTMQSSTLLSSINGFNTNQTSRPTVSTANNMSRSQLLSPNPTSSLLSQQQQQSSQSQPPSFFAHFIQL